MTGYLTTFASILDDFFKCLSDCGLMTSYTVQLQSNVGGVETLIKFRTIINELVKKLQSLLSSIPTVQLAEASTQTVDTREVVVTCHPINIAEFTNNTQILQSTTADQFPKDHNVKQQINKQTEYVRTSTTTCIKTSSSQCAVVPSLKICQIKPILLKTNEHFTEIVHLHSTKNEENKKNDVENIVHILVEASNNSAGHSSNNVNEDNIVNVQLLLCVKCDIKFESRKALKEHLQMKHANQTKIQICDMCDEVFTCVQSLQEHCRGVHEGAGCFVCSKCNRRFMTRLSYNRHIDTHVGNKKAICAMCGKAFSRADYLQTHYSIHLNKRNYACSQCPRKFVRRIQLQAHEKVHSGVKDHVCKECNKAFARSDKLKEHMMRHLNIKRFQCSVCQRDYAEKRDLRIHLKTH